jgi:hypothetical protein
MKYPFDAPVDILNVEVVIKPVDVIAANVGLLFIAIACGRAKVQGPV